MADENQANLTDTTLPGAAHVDASDGDAAVAETLSLAELNQYLGKDFKDKATALKAVKDTFSFVGKKQDAVQPPASVSPDLEAKVQSLQNEVFYANHPEYKGYESVIKAMGSDPAEVIVTDAFKLVFEKGKVADEVQSKRSVVASNSRLGSESSYKDDAVKLANANGASSGDIAMFMAAKLNESNQ